jgi:hypothetical protein
VTIDLSTERTPLDPRISPAVQAFDSAPGSDPRDRMIAAIAAADATDLLHDTHRITVDEETVERIAFTLGSIHSRGEEFDVRDFTRTARRILAALVGRPSPPGWGDQVGDVR